MKYRNFKETLAHRRSYYSLGNGSPVTDREIIGSLEFALSNVPSAFNSQSARLVLLLGEQHRKLWEIVTDILSGITSGRQQEQTIRKINKSFASGYGTVLFFEDQKTVARLQKENPIYENLFPGWSEQTSAMHQLAVWCMLEDMGFGASLQHYNPLIDGEVRNTWRLPCYWKLIAQMPFGMPLDAPTNKTYLPLEERISIFK